MSILRPGTWVSALVRQAVKLLMPGCRREAMVVGIFPEPNQFTFESLEASDISSVIRFAYQVAERAEHEVFVVAFEIDGREVGGPALGGSCHRPVLRLGREDALSKPRFGVGRDIVLWKPESDEWTCRLIAGHWREYHICWALLVDHRATLEVARDIQARLPCGYAKGDLHPLIDTVGTERKLAMVSYDGSYFAGKVSAGCWRTARALLEEIGGSQLEVYDGSVTPEG